MWKEFLMEDVEACIKAISLIIEMHYEYSKKDYGVYEGDSDYYIEVKIKDHYVDAILVEKLEEIGFKIHNFQSLNGKYGRLLSFSVNGDLID